MLFRLCRFIILLIFIMPLNIKSQSYPEWFISQKDINCKHTVVGYSYPFDEEDSSVEQAFNNGCVNYVRQLATNFSGGQAFLTTEIGAFWIGSDFTESFDTTTVIDARSKLQIIDTYSTKQIFAVLLSTEKCKIKKKFKRKISVKGKKPPDWTTNIPSDKMYEYAVGTAPHYHYEASSWMEAESTARKNLAKNLYVKIKSMHKKENQFQETQYEEMFVNLISSEIASRWRDVKNGIFYVLMRVPI